VVQDVFFTLWRNRANLDKIENVNAYLDAKPKTACSTPGKNMKWKGCTLWS
jgi:hypothetical protein